MMVINEKMKRRIKFLIRDKGFNQGKLAKEMGISQSYLSRKLIGNEAISESRMKQLCDILGTDINWILNGGEYEPDLPEDTLGKRLTKQIFKRWLTKEEFAQYAGIDTSAVSNWCNDNSMPSSNMIIYLHDVLQVSTDYLLLGKN